MEVARSAAPIAKGSAAVNMNRSIKRRPSSSARPCPSLLARFGSVLLPARRDATISFPAWWADAAHTGEFAVSGPGRSVRPNTGPDATIYGEVEPSAVATAAGPSDAGTVPRHSPHKGGAIVRKSN